LTDSIWTDLEADVQLAWESWIADTMSAAAAGSPDDEDADGPRVHFSPAKPVAGAVSLAVTWKAFPRRVMMSALSDTQRWMLADASRDVQDELCEWSVGHDPSSRKIRRVCFTCESPEYFRYLARVSPDRLLQIYRQHVSPEVQADELWLLDGRYNPRNRWNSSTCYGALHPVHTANTLAAVIELVAAATVVRQVDGRILGDGPEIVRAGLAGLPDRDSDPHIAAQVNERARGGARVSLGRPVGPSFEPLLTAGWKTPDGSDPSTYFRFVRGADGHAVRAVYEVPPERGFLVGDITINGRPIQYGGQIADFVRMRLSLVASSGDCPAALPRAPRSPRLPKGPTSVRDALRGPRRASRMST
jgi:hypothetical protein